MIKEGYKPSLGTFQLVLDKFLEGEDVAQVNQLVEWMKGAKAKPDEPLLAKFKEFEKRNNVGAYWS